MGRTGEVVTAGVPAMLRLSWISSVPPGKYTGYLCGVTTGCKLDVPGKRYSVQTSFGAHSASYPVGTGG
jgi:hypothetical protein